MDPTPEQLTSLVGHPVHTVTALNVEWGSHSRIFKCTSDIGDLILRVCKGQQGYYTHYFKGIIDESRWFDQGWALGKARELGLPVPDVVATDRSRRWVVMRKLPGVAIHAEYELSLIHI